MNNYYNDIVILDDNVSINKCENDNDWGEIVNHNTCYNSQHPESLSINSIQAQHNDMINDNILTEKINKIIDHIDIEEVKLLNISILDDIFLLEKASMIAKNLKFQFNKRCHEEENKFMTWIVTSLLWLKKVMHELAKRNKQNMISCTNSIDKQIKKPKYISRTSYKFCEFGCNCKFNYNIKDTCYAQHYVYNSVSHDISNIIDFIVEDYDTITLRHIYDSNDLIEIKTSINTVTYVVNHMYDELTQLKNDNEYYYENYTKRIYNFNAISKNKNIRN